MYRILSIDHGEVRIGVAISDPLHIISKPLKVINNTNFDNILNELKEIIESERVGEIVIGLPKNSKAEDTIRTEQVRNFAQKLKDSIKIPIVFFDEAYSTIDARNIVKQKGYSIKQTKEVIDMYAASIILTTYLQSQK